ncbi:Extensin family protein [Ancylobacter novellus DSM 506]|uniref:Extensin family protein n=1 Tax=Ancylobacter novellus (strain ATCC 8093 / DSM 506 / JCM 20403 / CCM 1077 / IAM 12100 / NBRC 12443 / NCIMB 10456) TaxID=639283 RepID=D7A7X6_ANCN5|nr:extensin family protein [Ancylobacter novellus]ADH90434.1 Extensin family protein [Ancylobacter novellus DSM 506]
MARGVSWFLVAPLVLLGLSGCKFGLFEQREPWRTEAEERCRAEGRVRPSAFIVEDRAINGAGACGMDHAYRITAFAEGSVEVSPRATLACPMTSAVDRWITQDVQPAAMAWFGQPVVKVKQMSSYSCRRMNGARTGKTSEHAFGNGLDVGGFVLADGREISVRKGWKGAPDEAGFLRTVQAEACERFSVVLAPGSNVYHYDHIHIDLMRRAPGRTTCKPAPQRPRPPNLPVYKAPPYKAPPFGAPWGSRPMSSSPAVEEPVTEQDVEEGYPAEGGYPPEAAAPAPNPYPATSSYPAANPYPAQSAYPAPRPRSTANAAPGWAAPAPRAPAPPVPQEVGEPMVLSPRPADPYGAANPYPANQYPPPAYPPQPAQNYPAPSYPVQNYPAQAAPAPSAYPPPSPYPPASDYPAQQPYPAPAPAPAAAPVRSRPPGVPLPPASVPLAKWLGLDPTPTGSTGNVRSFTTEREFASPIPAPRERAD